MKKIAAALLFPLLFALTTLDAAVPRDFAIDLKAEVSDSAPHITLSWTQRLQSNITAQKIHRRLKGATTWVKLADLTTTQTSYQDATAAPNVEYEYWMERSLSGVTPSTAMGYISAGVKVPEVQARGVLLLLVDDTMVAPLAQEIAQLKDDLTADGWTVQQITASRAGTAIDTKALVKAAYDADPANVKMLYILGHVPVPYSGNLSAPDGHGNHNGAWPTDGYYAELNGTWTDSSVNYNPTSYSRVTNVPGDGRFDQTTFPSLLELQVGRVDMWSLQRSPSSAVTETALLRRYLRKAHDFRYKLGAYAAIPRRTLIRDGFGILSGVEPIAINGWEPAFTGVGNPPAAPVIDEAPATQWFTYATNNSYLLGHCGGGGNYESMGNVGTSTDFGHKPSKVVFTSVFGSYFGDWDVGNNLMRSILAGNAEGTSLALTSFWVGRPNYMLHHPGMGETIGYATRVSQNAFLTGGGGYVPSSFFPGYVHVGLMGDPALRLHMVEPPRNFNANSANGQVTLNWTASAETALLGYHVYRAPTTAGPFIKLTAAPQFGTTYTDATATAGLSYAYMVRTLILDSVPGGSYYNLSQGSLATLTVNAGSTVAPLNPSALAVVPISATNAQLSWTDNASDETGFRIERKTNAAGTFATIGTLTANTTSWTDPGTFAHGDVYYYRVIATGAADSLASNEVSFDAVAGFVEFTATKMKVNKTAGTAAIDVTRFGGGTGAVSVGFATASSSAVAGTHFTSTTGTLSWADGELGVKTINVPVTNTATPQLPRQFKVTLNTPTNGLGLAQWTSIAVQIEDPTATLDPAWTSTMIGTITDSSPAVNAETGIGDSTMGGSGAVSGATSEAGRFIYQSHTGDGILTMQVPIPALAQSGARFAVMVRASTNTNVVMAATVGASAAANFGTKIVYRSTAGGSATATPAADNNQDIPQWLRLTRAGNTFTSESSVDGTTWITLGSTTLASMPANALWGIFHYSADWASSTNYLGDYQLATYQNISLTGLPAPAAPLGLAFGTVTNTSVPLTWTAATYAAGYRIERRGDDGSLDLIDIASGATTSYSDTGVRADTAYAYRILAYNSTGDSAWSSSVRTLTLPPDVTTVLTTDGAGNADATLRADSTTTNFGSTTTLPVTDTDITTGELTPVTKAWLRFDLGALPTLKTARLKLAYVGEQNLQAAFDAGSYYGMQVRLLAEGSDTWDENTIQWDNAPQNSTLDTGVTGTAPNLANYFHYDASTLPAANSTVTLNLTASTINTNRGANNLITLALIPSASFSGSMIWASREHATLPPPTLEVVTSSTQPRRPGFLTTAPGSGSSVILNWFDSTSDETGFQIERRVANGEWTLLQALAADVTSFTDTTALPGVIYDYRIRTLAAAGNSSWATVPSVTHSSVASITGAIFSADNVTFSHADTPTQKAYVPTGFTYYTPASNFVTGQTLSTTIRSNFAGWLGMKFTTGATPVVVRELGRWVISGNTGAHTVKLVDATTSTNVPGGSVSVDTAGAPAGFKYAPLAIPVTLAANTTYYLVSLEVNGGDQWYEGGNTLTYATSIATVNQSVYSGNGITYTTAYSPNNSYIPVSFKYSAAASPLVSSHSMTTLRNDYTGWLGMEITTGNTVITVSELGRWVLAGNTGSHNVKLVEAATGSTLGSVTVPTAGAPADQFKYTALPAVITLAPNTSYYVLSQENAGGDQWYDFTTPAPGTATGYQNWLLANGLPMDGSGSGSASATPANDGLPNLIKYALGLSPGSNGNGGRLNYGKTNDAGTDYLTFTYTRPEPAPADITYTVESSPDLTPLSWTGTGLTEISNTSNGTTRTITIRDNTPMTGSNRRFMRLKITQP